MSSRKEEERNEKIIRGLMKLPPNRRCINCNSLGPQYVCTNFWTFVCMTCSGIHREFTHRVKSVSMSKFTTQEVEALQEGGNQRARETFLKDWDPREQRLPDNSNVDRVREFIKSVYVDKKFFASKGSGKPPMNPRNHEDETRRASSYHSYSQSPPYDYQYEERRYGKQAPSLTKKPGSDRGMLRFLSTSRLSDHVQQEDRFANEVPNARASDYSARSGADPFSSPKSEPLRDNLSQNVQQSSVNTNMQKTDSSTPEQSGKFDGLDLFSAPYAPQSATSAPSTEPQKFDALDLFSAPYAPQSSTSAPSAIDLFDFSATSSASSLTTSQPPNNSIPPVNQKFQPFEPSSLDLFTNMPLEQNKTSDAITQKNEGWATFDMPWHAEINQDTKSSMAVSETSTSEKSTTKFDQVPSIDKSPQSSFHQEFNANGPSSLTHTPWHGGVHDFGAPLAANINQTWNAFGEASTPFQNIYTKSSEQGPIPDPYLAWGISENFEMKQADVDIRPDHFLSTMPHVIGSLDATSELPVLEGAQSHKLDAKSRNPFDFPSDDLEASNMFLDMSSLQSALPNHNSWFPENASLPYSPGKSQDPLAFMAVQPPSMQIPNIQAQGHVAPISGNPFG